MAGRKWAPEELLLVLHLYERIPFGQQDSRNAQVMALAHRLDRTPGSVAMKLNNFTSLDPEEKARGVKGLPGASELDRRTWAEFHRDPAVVLQAEELWNGPAAAEKPLRVREREPRRWTGETETTATRQVRLAQSYFRRVVLANFGERCALTGISAPELLTASHIVGWAESLDHRVDPKNGLCLNRLHDAAFDQKLITFDEDLRLVVGRRLADQLPKAGLAKAFLAYKGTRLANPQKHDIAPSLLAEHRQAFLAAERT